MFKIQKKIKEINIYQENSKLLNKNGQRGKKSKWIREKWEILEVNRSVFTDLNNSRLDMTEDRVSELEDSSKEFTQKAAKTEIQNMEKQLRGKEDK